MNNNLKARLNDLKARLEARAKRLGLPRITNDPIGSPQGYTLDCYCIHENADHGHVLHGGTYSQSFDGPSKQAVERDAKERGWIKHPGGFWSCPICNPRSGEKRA